MVLTLQIGPDETDRVLKRLKTDKTWEAKFGQRSHLRFLADGLASIYNQVVPLSDEVREECIGYVHHYAKTGEGEGAAASALAYALAKQVILTLRQWQFLFDSAKRLGVEKSAVKAALDENRKRTLDAIHNELASRP